MLSAKVRYASGSQPAAGTGLANLINAWCSFVLTCNDVKGIDDLNMLAPNALRTLTDACFGSDLTTSTLYHFGHSKVEGQYVGYAYRSERGFDPDRLQYALGIKPVIPVAPTENISFPEFLVDIVLEQQRRDQRLKVTDQVGIGGEIEFVDMSEGAIHVETVHCFASYEAECAYIAQHAEI